MKKSLVVFIAILCLVSILSACTGDTSPSVDSDLVSQDSNVIEKDSYGVGETATTKNYKITAESLNYITSDNQFIQPAEGKKFIEAVLLIENISDAELNISSLINFDAYLDDLAIDMDLMGQTVSKNQTMDGTIASGKKLRGSLCYQVPENWSELEINVNLNLFSDKEVVLLFKNQ